MSLNGCINMWYIRIVYYYFIIKKNKGLIHATTQTDVEGVLSERKTVSKGYILYEFNLYNIVKMTKLQ